MWFCHYEALPCRPFRMEAYVWCPHAIWSIWQCNIFQVWMILSLRILLANVMILSSTSPRIAGNMWDFQPSCGNPQAPGLDFLPCRLVDWWRGVFIDGQSVGAAGTAGWHCHMCWETISFSTQTNDVQWFPCLVCGDLKYICSRNIRLMTQQWRKAWISTSQNLKKMTWTVFPIKSTLSVRHYQFLGVIIWIEFGQERMDKTFPCSETYWKMFTSRKKSSFPYKQTCHVLLNPQMMEVGQFQLARSLESRDFQKWTKRYTVDWCSEHVRNYFKNNFGSRR